MELTSFSIIILLTVALTVFIESYRGKIRGLNKSAVTLGSLILSVIIASVIAYPISGLASQSFYEGLIESDGLDQIKMQFPSFDRLANAYITAIIAPVVFLILFWILRMIIAIVISVVYKTSLKRKKDDPGYTSTEIPWYKKNSSLLGGITGFFTGVILSLVILSPFVGTLKIADDATSTLEKNSKFISGITFNNAEFDAIKRYSDEWPTVSLRALGGDLIYNSVSMVSLDGQAVPLRKEIENIDLTMSVLNHTTEILRDISSISKDNVIILEEALEKLKYSPSFKLLASDFLSEASGAWLSGEQYMGMSKFEAGGIVDPIVNELLKVCTKTTPDAVCEDLSTILHIFLVAADNDLIGSQDLSGIIDKLNENDLIDQFCAVLIRNPRMAYIADGVWEISIKAVSYVIKHFNYTGTQYEDLMSEFAESLNSVKNYNYEKRVEFMTDHVQRHIHTLGINLPTDISEIVAEAMVSEIEGFGGVIDSRHVKNFFNSYS